MCLPIGWCNSSRQIWSIQEIDNTINNMSETNTTARRDSTTTPTSASQETPTSRATTGSTVASISKLKITNFKRNGHTQQHHEQIHQPTHAEQDLAPVGKSTSCGHSAKQPPRRPKTHRQGPPWPQAARGRALAPCTVRSRRRALISEGLGQIRQSQLGGYTSFRDINWGVTLPFGTSTSSWFDINFSLVSTSISPRF